MAKRAQAQADLARLEESGETQLSRTDADARLLSKNGQMVAGYNVQIAVDDKHKLIVASEVVNDGNDTGQLHAMAEAAKAGARRRDAAGVADTGYYNGETLQGLRGGRDRRLCAASRARQRGWRAQGRFSLEDVHLRRRADVYRCPAGAELRPLSEAASSDAGGKLAYPLCQPPVRSARLSAALALSHRQGGRRDRRALGA